MTAVSKNTIKTYFETGDKPTASQFSDFVDSCLFLAESSAQTIQGGIIVSGNVVVSGALSVHGGGTLNGFTINTPTVSAGTFNAPIINTPTVSAGIFNSPAINTPTVSAGTYNSPIINTPTVSAGTFASPALTGTPTTPTADPGTNTTQIASTAFVVSAMANLGSSGLTLITTVTAAASAITYSGFNSTYDVYFITGSRVRPSTDGVGIRLRYSIDGGSSYLSSGYTAQNNQFKAAAFNGEGPTDAIYVVPTTAGYRSSNLEGAYFEMYMHGAGVTGQCYTDGNGSYLESAGSVNIKSLFSGTWRGGNNAVNAIEIAPTGGGLGDGVIRIYGLKKS